MSGASSAELLQTIAEALGVEVEVIMALGRDRSGDGVGAGPAGLDQRILLARMVRAFRALPDAANQLQAVQYVEALAAPAVPAD